MLPHVHDAEIEISEGPWAGDSPEKSFGNCDLDHRGKARPHLFSAQFPTGATAMAGTRWTGKRRALVIATFTLACVAFLSTVAAPNPVSIAELGNNWQCSKTAFVLTTCTLI